MAPKVISKGSDRAGGVLPVNAATRAAASNKPASRLKLEIRRLPPGLTLSEFEEVLGEEWKLGKGKVDWREYRQGKLKAPGKIPEQSRCYVHLANETVIKEFEQRFLSIVFHDKAGTHKHAELKHLPPTLGFAPSQRTPLQVKQRADNRQGTIDQDPEFIEFLEAETQPLGRPSAPEQNAGKDHDPVKTTPLIEDLRERKAQRAKAAAEKAEKKKTEDKKAAGHARSGSKDAIAEKGETKNTQQKVEQAAKEAAKVLNKQAATKQQQATIAGQATSAKGVASPAKAKKAAPSPRQQNATPVQTTAATSAHSVASPGPASPAPDRRPPGQRQRGNADGIKKMLQKDLGIRSKATTTDSSTSSSKPSAVARAVAETATSSPIPLATTPAPATTKAPAISKPAPIPLASTTKAYLKHANPSQGMTEILILRSLSEFGEVTNVTIDPRKGTAIANFKDNEGLKKAMAERKVSVASGAVEVLEFREGSSRGPSSSVRGRGGFRGGKGGGRGGAAAAGSPASSASGTPAPAA
ncbi:hypothetical protein LTR78_002084 [Recurvomyces mirabilis]|uniref:UPF3 domain-containing protein n=1 Tax=Recurvomyces mirabilis TaxID=574656 RepID=A0AAE1C4K3_9PEZI|nr:hypothetical protein LTR78_002084 [Recurvomyces mirabilis]KAK5160542.1 hypothetical protein LTS14_001554 [Recurvomyces mirabilis]